MSKKYSEYTSQISKIMMDKKMVWAYANIKPIAPESFMDESESTIAIAIREYEKPGYVIFYLSHKELKNLLFFVQKEKSLTTPLIHFVGSQVETKKEAFKGLSYCSRFFMSYESVGQQGEVIRNPWKLGIQNGYALRCPGKQNGSWYPKAKTFKKESENFVSLSSMDILHFLEECLRRFEYLDNKLRDAAFDKGMQGYIEKIERGTPTAGQNTYSKTVTNKKDTKSSEKFTGKKSIITGVFATIPEPVPNRGGYIGKFRVGSKVSDVCVLKPTQNMVKAAHNNLAITVACWVGADKTIFIEEAEQA